MNDFINRTLIPKIMKFVSTKPMVAFRNGMLYTMPFSIIGSVFYYLRIFRFQVLQRRLKMQVCQLTSTRRLVRHLR
jgi:PTS system cellobiose-specific IIC component